MGAKHRKGKIFNFSFLVFMGLRGRTPYAVSARSEKRLIAPSKKLMEVQATISITDLTKLQTLGSIILLSFFEY
jgi:hypothetical protein